MKRKIMIVIEETGEQDGQHFQVYMAGDKVRLGNISIEEMSPAEFWASKLFQVCGHALRTSGAVQSETQMNKRKAKQ